MMRAISSAGMKRDSGRSTPSQLGVQVAPGSRVVTRIPRFSRLFPERAGEAEHGMLGDAVGDASRVSSGGGDGSKKKEMASFLFEHGGEKGSGYEVGGQEVRVQLGLEGLRVGFEEAAWQEAAGVIYHDLRGAEAAEDLTGYLLNPVRDGHIAGKTVAVAPASRQREATSSSRGTERPPGRASRGLAGQIPNAEAAPIPWEAPVKTITDMGHWVKDGHV
jgi:hypothetical protein